MNILVEIDHPGHVHFFKHALKIWQDRGHATRVVARDKDVTTQLLKECGIAFIQGSARHANLVQSARDFLCHIHVLVRAARQLNANVLLSVGSTYAAWAAALLRKPHIAFDDTEHARLEHLLYRPFSDIVCTPSCYQEDFGPKQHRYEGYHELAYLHPRWFEANPQVLGEMGLAATDVYSVIRFVSWEAIHDRGRRGFSEGGKRRLVRELQRKGRVIISAESPLPADLEPYRLTLSPAKMHDVLYFSSLYIGEGATMASEAAMLGLPSIYVNPLSAGTLNEQEHRYGLLHQVTHEGAATDLAVRLVKDPGSRAAYETRRRRMLAEKIDVTAWMVDFVERFQHSPMPMAHGRNGWKPSRSAPLPRHKGVCGYGP
jgi:hypothetical protein